jgi:hypothetical protein
MPGCCSVSMASPWLFRTSFSITKESVSMRMVTPGPHPDPAVHQAQLPLQCPRIDGISGRSCSQHCGHLLSQAHVA